jgi:uncharacterized cysteine cluster protein YcgN (CxxCxxCC family)
MLIDIDHEIERAAIYFRDKAKKEGRKALSRLFVVLDHGGGWRFVVTRKWEIEYHLGPTEKSIEVPKVRIAEPVEWNDIGRTVTLAERYATKKLAKHNACGGCRACCVIMQVETEKLHKPAHHGCPHLDSCTAGCRIYPVRPQICKDFECEWLVSQRLNDRMPEWLRPDRCGVMFTKGKEPGTIEAHRDLHWPTDPFASEEVSFHIAMLEHFGMTVIRHGAGLSH